MGFSAKQVQALRRNLDHRHVRTREANGRELYYIKGWYHCCPVDGGYKFKITLHDKGF